MKNFIRSLLKGLSIPAMLLTANVGSAADFKERNIKLGYGIPEEHPLGQGVNKFAQLVREKSDGNIKVKGFAANVLGSETQMISATIGNVQQMVILSSAAVVSNVKELALFDLLLFSPTRKRLTRCSMGRWERNCSTSLPPAISLAFAFGKTGSAT